MIGSLSSCIRGRISIFIVQLNRRGNDECESLQRIVAYEYGIIDEYRLLFLILSLSLLEIGRMQRDGHRFQSGRKITFAPRVFFGAAENPMVPPLEHRALRLGKKIAAGAQFIQTQYCYDLDRLRAFMRAVEDQGLLAEFGRSKAQDQVDAQNALIDSKNQRTQALVTHTIARLQFWNNMGILYIKADGQWEEVQNAKTK